MKTTTPLSYNRSIFIVCLLLTAICFGQKSKSDSLWKTYNQNTNADTIRLKAIQSLMIYYKNNNPDTAIALGNKEIELADKSKLIKYKADAEIIIGQSYEYKGNFPKSFEYYISALKIYENIGNKQGMSKSYRCMAIIYRYQSDHENQLKYNFMSLKLCQQIKDKRGIAVCYNNISLYYSDKANYAKALEYLTRSLEISKQINDKETMARCYINMGNSYQHQSNYNKALENQTNALKIKRELNDTNGMGVCYINLGDLYNRLSKVNIAIQYSDSAILISKKTGEINQQQVALRNISFLYSKAGLYKQAYNSQVEFKGFTDSIFNIERDKKINDLKSQYEIGKRDEQMNSMKSIAIEENKRHRIITYCGISIFILVLTFSLFIFNRFRTSQKQKLVIEQKQTEILDSIHYAKRIQDALLKEQNHVSLHLPEHFVLFKPKDIVSGDFYWGLEKQGHWYLAAADCTGHGVPGAFLTMLGTSFLNEINATDKLLTPAEILDSLRARMIKELGQTGKSGENKDGMDISLLRINLGTKQLQWAGANNPLYIISNNELQETKANKQPIGYSDNIKPFTNHEFDLKQNDSIYIFSDGYADQFGGPNGKKFMSRQLKETLATINTLGMNEQKTTLNKSFEDWKGSLQQIDDVCVISVRV